MNDLTPYVPVPPGGAGVWDWDFHSVFRLSPQLEALLGFPPGGFDATLDAFYALLVPVDCERVALAFAEARERTGVFSIEFRVAGGDGQPRWMGAQAEVLRHGGEGNRRLVGTMQEVGAGVAAERRMRRQQASLLDLATRGTLRDHSLADAFRYVTVVAAETLEVARVGIWFFDPTGTVLECVALQDRAAGRHERGARLESARYPRYFDSLIRSRAAAIADARSDPRTSELAADYLAPLSITSMLDAAVRRSGHKIGVVCHEHTGPVRSWTLDEQGFAASVADFVGELVEANARREAEAALRESEERYRAFVEQSTEAIFRVVLDTPVSADLPVEIQIARVIAQARVAECNLAFAHTVGADACGAVVGRAMVEFVGERRCRTVLEAWISRGHRLRDFEIESVNARGDPVWLSVSLVGMISEGALHSVWGIWRDITDRRRALAALEHQTRHDGLTGLPNRDSLTGSLDAAITSARAAGSSFALLLIDLDHFKEVNDTLGHFAGDALLRAVGVRLLAALDQDGASLSRLGGDEFAVVAARATSGRAAESVAMRVLGALREPFDIDGARLEIGASIGIAVYPDDGEDASSMMRRADVAMYVAKSGRSGYSRYRPDEDPHSTRRLELLSELGTAVRGRRLVLHYQPKVDLAARTLQGFEVLCRWPHDRHGWVPPDEFIRLAEMGDLIKALTLLVIDEAFAQWARWADAGLRPHLALNLSARNLADDSVLFDLSDALERHGVPASHVEFEITESAFVADPERVLVRLQKLQALGVTLAVDDFGTGFSSLTYLRRMPLHALKIDRSFVQDMIDNAQDRTIVNSTINLAHNLGLEVVAEGIETEAAFDLLQSLGCDIGQGYWISRPMPADAVAPWLAQAGWRVPEAGAA